MLRLGRVGVGITYPAVPYVIEDFDKSRRDETSEVRRVLLGVECTVEITLGLHLGRRACTHRVSTWHNHNPYYITFGPTGLQGRVSRGSSSFWVLIGLGLGLLCFVVFSLLRVRTRKSL